MKSACRVFGFGGLVAAIVGMLAPPAAKAQDGLTPKTLAERLAGPHDGQAGDRLADDLRAWFGKANLAKAPNPKIDGLDVAWAIEAKGAIAPVVISEDGGFRLPLIRVGDTDIFAAAVTLPEGTAMRWAYSVDGRRTGGFAAGGNRGAGQLEVYKTDPDSLSKPGVPHGTLTQQKPWSESKIYPNTSRDWWVYVPAQYKSSEPACVMVFQDGAGYKDFVPTVFDNLIAKGEMPVTVGIFINPGTGAGGDGRGQRSYEYDTLNDRYARFLLEEILPEVETTVKLRHDPDSRAVAGISSGGICAWTVAWERPSEFRKVLSWVGSFTNIASGPSLREGGHNYEALIRKSDKKPIRVFLQDGSHDLDNANWPLANQQMARALAFKGYDYKFVYGQGFHSNRHGRAILPDSLRWLWRDYQPSGNP